MAGYEHRDMRTLIRKLAVADRNFEIGQALYIQGKLTLGELNKLGAKVDEIRSEIERQAETN